MESLIDDLQLLHKDVYFWNWNHETIGVMYRTNAKHVHLFKTASNEEDLLKMMISSKVPSTDSIETAQTDVTSSVHISA